jgi:hypothetical protein
MSYQTDIVAAILADDSLTGEEKRLAIYALKAGAVGQKAQEIVTVKAMPLRVNLPRRGQQLSFTQTLQTEIRKPMSVEFAAVESKGVGMLTVTGLSVAGFGLLWGLLALLMRRRVS